MGKENELITAVKEGNGQYVRKSLQKYRRGSKKGNSKKTTVNFADVEGFTALHHAALLGDVEIIMAIIEMEGDPNVIDKKGMTPLHMAAWAGKDGAVKCLVDSRALPNMPSLNRDTPLHLAAQHGYASCAKVLLAAHGDGTFRNSNQATPLDLACQFGHTAVVKQLLQSDAVTSALASSESRFISPLHQSAKSGHDDIVHLLLQAGADVNENRPDGTALHLASLYGKKEVVKLLLGAGADVTLKNKDGMVALDVVNKFTSSHAGLEIKQMLREASGYNMVYAKAVSDYSNQYDETCLNFKVGDTIAVLEQNEDGRWKGYVVHAEIEKMGYFPAMAVQLTVPRINAASLNSVASGSSSSSSEHVMEEGLIRWRKCSLGPKHFRCHCMFVWMKRGHGSHSSEKPRPKEPVTPTSTAQPVGMVPIGNFEVVTLAQGDQEVSRPPKQTAAGSLPPRMSSFKNKQRNNAKPTSSIAPKVPEQMISEETNQQIERLPKPIVRSGSNTADRSSGIKESIPKDIFRNRASSAERSKHEFSQNLKQIIGTRIPGERPLQKTKYVDVEIKNSAIPNSVIAKTDYTDVYISDNSDNVDGKKKFEMNGGTVDASNMHNSLVNSNLSTDTQKQATTPTSPNRCSLFHGVTKNITNELHNKLQHKLVYEDMEVTQTQPRASNKTPSPPLKPKLEIPSISHTPPTIGYEDMTGSFKRIEEQTVIPYKEKRSPHLPPMLPPKDNMGLNKRQKDTPTPPLREKPPALPIKQQAPDLPLKKFNNTPQKTTIDLSELKEYKLFSNQNKQRISYENCDPNKEEGISPQLPSPGELLIEQSICFDDNEKVSPLQQRSAKMNQEVYTWLSELDLTCYCNAFKSHGFDMESIRAITPEDLTFLEILEDDHRKKLLFEIAKLTPSDRIPNTKPTDVGSWLGQLNLRQYEPNFVEGGFDDMDFIKDLDRNDLDMIDIKKRGHQKKLLLAVRHLNDLELTDILDQVVSESPKKRAYSPQTSTSSSVSYQPEQFQLPPATEKMAATAMYQREGISPSSPDDKHSLPSPRRLPPVAAKPNAKAPVPVPPKPGMNGTPQTAGKPSPPIPSVKPKPKPGSRHPAQVGTADEAKEEVVTSSRSRDFFKQKEQKSLNESPTSSIDRRGSSSSTGSSNTDQITPPSTIKRAPLPPTKPKPATTPTEEEAPPLVTPVKKPPPAPPKRADSIKSSLTTESKPIAVAKPPTPTKPKSPDVCFSPPIPTFIPPPPPDTPVDDIPEEELPPPPEDLMSPSPSSEVTPVDVTPKDVTLEATDSVVTKEEIDDGFGETEDIMSNIIADLDDFSAQLDSMF